MRIAAGIRGDFGAWKWGDLARLLLIVADRLSRKAALGAYRMVPILRRLSQQRVSLTICIEPATGLCPNLGTNAISLRLGVSVRGEVNKPHHGRR